MPLKDKLLTDRAIRTAKAGPHNDGNGLTLRVGASGKRSWVLRYTWNGKPANLGLGSYPDIGLKTARALAAERRGEIAEGAKPTGAREAAASKKPVPQKPTFREIAGKVIELRSPRWSSDRHAKQWIESLTNHAYPVIGDMDVASITSGDVLGMLELIWNSKPETGTRVKQRAQVVFAYAIAKGLRADNPVAALDGVLPKRKRLQDHHPGLPYTEVPASVSLIRKSPSHVDTRLAMEFCILTAGRAGETRGMVWPEVDLEGRTWTVPANRMKSRKEHRVPLSDRAIEILKEAEGLKRGDGLVFPGRNGGELSDMAFAMMLRRLGIECVPHGFRSSFKDWALSETSAPWAVSEAALAHNLGNSMEAAYARTDLFDKRRDLMGQWAEFVGG